MPTVAEQTSQKDTETLSGITALLWVCMFGRDEVIRLLLDHGADTSATATVTKEGETMAGLTPLMAACSSDNTAAVRLLLDHSPGPDLEATAVLTGQNGLALSGYTALMGTCNTGSAQMVRLLLDHGAELGPTASGVDEDGENVTGYTALHIACKASDDSQSLACVTLLLERGMAVDTPAADGSTALHVAVKHEMRLVVTALLAAGANPNATKANGISVLQCARAGSTIASDLTSAGARE